MIKPLHRMKAFSTNRSLFSKASTKISCDSYSLGCFALVIPNCLVDLSRDICQWNVHTPYLRSENKKTQFPEEITGYFIRNLMIILRGFSSLHTPLAKGMYGLYFLVLADDASN